MKSQALDNRLASQGWTGLQLNSQSLPTKPFASQENKPGENIYFWTPLENRVARFGAGSVRAGLGCGRDPVDRYSSLGVYGVANAI